MNVLPPSLDVTSLIVKFAVHMYSPPCARIRGLKVNRRVYVPSGLLITPLVFTHVICIPGPLHTMVGIASAPGVRVTVHISVYDVPASGSPVVLNTVTDGVMSATVIWN